MSNPIKPSPLPPIAPPIQSWSRLSDKGDVWRIMGRADSDAKALALGIITLRSGASMWNGRSMIAKFNRPYHIIAEKWVLTND